MTEERDGSELTPSADSRPRGRRTAVVRTLLSAVLVAALALAVERGLAWRDAERREQARADVVEAAGDEVVGLITISARTTDEDLEELIEGATATFQDDLREQADRLRQEVVENEVEATGEVVSAGPVRRVVAESPAFAPQVTKVLGAPWLRVDEVVRALAPRGESA